MSAPYCGKKVKIDGVVSRSELNGKRGVATSFDDNRGRYMVKLTSGEVVALKPSNLIEIPESDASSPMEMLEEYKEKLLGYLAQAEAQLPPGVKAREVAFAGVGLLFLARQIGVARALAIALVLFLVIVAFVPAFKAAESKLEGVKAGFAAVGDFSAKHASTLAKRPISRNQAFAGLGAVLVLLFALGTFAPTGGSRPISQPSSENVADAYGRGFQDATDGKDYGSSLPPPTSDPPPAASSSSSRPSTGGFDMSKIVSLGMLGKTVYDLGGKPWSPQAVMANFQTMPNGQKAVSGLMLARLLGFSPF